MDRFRSRGFAERRDRPDSPTGAPVDTAAPRESAPDGVAGAGDGARDGTGGAGDAARDGAGGEAEGGP